MSQWKDFCLHILTKNGKNRLFLFHQHTSCLLRLHCQLDWQDWLSLYCSYLYQFPELSHQDCLGVLGNSILIVFFFFTSTNYFRRQLSSRRNNLKLLSSEFSLWTIFYIIENRLAFIHIVDLQRLDWIWCSSFTTFHLTSGKEISSLFKKGNIFWKPRHPFGWSLWRFEVHLVTVLKSDGMKFIEAII